MDLYDCGDSEWYYTEYGGEKGYVYADYVNYYGDTYYQGSLKYTSISHRKGEISCHGDIVPGYSTSYIVNGGAVAKERNSLGDTWHVTAKNACQSYGKSWYELWDSDDGDYYGWVDEEHIYFY